MSPCFSESSFKQPLWRITYTYLTRVSCLQGFAGFGDDLGTKHDGAELLKLVTEAGYEGPSPRALEELIEKHAGELDLDYVDSEQGVLPW